MAGLEIVPVTVAVPVELRGVPLKVG